MDPIANIKRQRELAAAIIALNGSLEVRETGKPTRAVWHYAEELAELVQALDEWRLSGGFDPYDHPRSAIGREAALTTQFADDLHRSFGGPPMAQSRTKRLKRHRSGKLYKHAAGGSWEVLLVDDEQRETGCIAQVKVSYSRFDTDAANAR